MGSTNCGLMEATANVAPAANSRPLTSNAIAIAISAATSKLSCCSFKPWVAGKLPSVSATMVSSAIGGARQPIARSHSGTLKPVTITNSH